MTSTARFSAMKNHSPIEDLALELEMCARCLTAVWDVTGGVDSGAVTATPGVQLNNRQGLAAIFPALSMIYQVMAHAVTLPVSASNNGTIALRAEADGDLLATVDPDATNWSETRRLGIPDAATTTDWVVTTVARQLGLVIATNAFSAGKIYFHCLYVVDGNG